MKKRDDAKQLTNMKRSYHKALKKGRRLEQARWANMIGGIYMNAKGDYDEALKWFQIDYNLCADHYFSQKELLPTYQSLGEVYLRLSRFSDAILYQKKHLVIAKNIDDMVEVQRACTQLGRTYHEIFTKTNDDQTSLQKAREYFTAALKLAQIHKERRSNSTKRAFVKEYVDAHNNIAMIELDRDRFDEAEKYLTMGLRLCDEEKIDVNDESRARFHHNLGSVYMELRKWDEARQHIEKEIEICRNIGHRQGQAKGFINLGELLYRLQDYDAATVSFKNAMEFADGEQSLANQISQNLETVKEATKVMDYVKKQEEHLELLTSHMTMFSGKADKRKCLRMQKACLDRLIEHTRIISSWNQHLRFARKKTYIAGELVDPNSVAESYLVIGLSYQKLRNFTKAKKWCYKSFKKYREINDVKGQALANLNLGNALDSMGEWGDAFHAFRRTNRMARQANLPHVQLSALENMHFSQLIRFDNVAEAMKLQSQIDELKRSIGELGPSEVESDY
uniref:protein TONSOKU-like n=1 Tax=Erigeron canadensis TaxID=72917 RepID=UPI001CB9B6A1|nr:protein TONSOKU-like [Erigeron canadensis]